MSINLSRRDALKGAMAAGAAIAASPYLLNLTGGLSAAIPSQTVPAQAASSLPAASAGSAASGSIGETTVLVIKGDVVSSYRGMQTVKVQDGALASKLRNAVLARYE